MQLRGEFDAGSAGVLACAVSYTDLKRHSRRGRLRSQHDGLRSQRQRLRSRYGIACFIFACFITQIGCSRSNNLLLGRVEATVPGHRIEVTDCYRTSVPAPRQLPDLPGGTKVYEFMPCRDADVLIRGEELIVNGTSYGMLKQGDVITVDHGKVLINEHAALAKSQR